MDALSHSLLLGEPVNSTAWLSGRICGHRCVASPGARFVTGSGIPPAAETRESSAFTSSAAMMLPSSPQDPPRRLGASHNTTAAPPRTEIFLSLPSDEKPIH